MKRILMVVLPLLCTPAWAQNAVSVRVLDAQNVPLANAQVALRIWGEKKWREETLRTDKNGRATFSLLKPVDPKKPVGSVVVHAPGFALDGHAINSDALEFHLQAGTTWRGQVVDEAGKPLANAKVQVSSVVPKGSALHTFLLPTGEELRSVYSARSGADGTFSVADVPVGSKLSYGSAAPHYAGGSGYDVLADVAAHIALVPGGALEGRLLGLDGKPLEGIGVFAQSTGQDRNYGEAKTDKDGHYLIDSLSAGNYNVMVTVPDGAPYIVPAAVGVGVGASQTNPVPDLKAIEGVVVAGVVRDKATHKPVTNARIGVYGPDRPASSAAMVPGEPTGDDGRFSVRVVPGQNKFYFYQTPENYLRDNGEQTVEIGETPTPLNFEIQKAPTLTGTTVDEAGHPTKAQLRTWGDTMIQSDESGKWSWKANSLSPIFVGGGEDESGYFEVLTNQKWDVTSPAPLVVKVRKHPWQSLDGRVVSPDKTPLANVEVTATFFFEVGDDGGLGQTTRTATTGADGRFYFAQIRGGQAANDMANGLKVNAVLPGSTLAGGGDISANGANWTASDIVLSQLNRHIEGTTDKGARVVAAGKETRADEVGHFALDELPGGQLLVVAALNGRFGSAQTTKENAPLAIALAPVKAQGVDVELGRNAWREVVREAGNGDFYALSWVNGQLAAPGDGGFDDLKRAPNGPTTATGDWALSSQLAKWAPKLASATRLASLEEVARGISRPEIRLNAWLNCALESDDVSVAKRALAEAKTALSLAPPEFVWRELNLYSLAVVTARVEGDDAGTLALNRAMAWTLAHHPEKSFSQHGQNIEPSRDQIFGEMTSVVARGSGAMLKQLLEAIDPDGGERVRGLAEAIPVVAKSRGVEAALPLLDELGAMPMPDFPKGDSHPSNNEPKWAFDQAARRLVAPLGTKSPARALELARRVSDLPGRARALATAANFQTPEIAATLWREAVTSGDVADAPRFAAQAWEHDPKLGRELFELARARANSVGAQNSRAGFWTTFAFYFARVDAASARLELEREWSKTQSAGETELLGSIVMSMSAANGERALEMARAIPNGKDNFWSLEARRKIGQYLIASEDERRDWPFDRWNAGDTWSPGDAEW